MNDALTKHDLSFRWETDNGTEGLIRVTCVLTHEMGHSERTMLQATPDTSGKKNPIQAIGSTVTYLQRYTLLAATGMAVQGQDDDGRGAANNDDGPVTPQQARDIHEELGKAGLDAGPVCDWRSVETVEDIKAADYDRVISAIRQKGAAK